MIFAQAEVIQSLIYQNVYLKKTGLANLPITCKNQSSGLVGGSKDLVAIKSLWDTSKAQRTEAREAGFCGQV